MVEANQATSNRGMELAPETADPALVHNECELRNEPPDIYLDAHIMDMKFSPTCNMLALSQVTGNVRVYAYNESRMDQVLDMTHHKESVRTIDFSPSGHILYAAGKDKSFSVISHGRLEGQLLDAHNESINKISHVENDHVIATGDDDGTIKIWDLRQAQSGKQQSCVMSLKEHEGSISDFAYNEQAKMLCSVANDGMLGVWDLRKSKLYAMSDSLENDLNAMCLMKNNKKVVSCAGDGSVNIFSWDWFGDCNDRIVGHPNSIECAVKYDEDTIITGGEDGLLRAVSVLPNRIIAILGDPLDTEDEVFFIQKVSVSHCKNWLASCALDDMVKICEISNLQERPTDGTFDLEAYERGIESKLVANHGKMPFSAMDDEDQDGDEGQEGQGGMDMDDEESKEPNQAGENDWSDQDDSDDDDSDDSDDSDMSENKMHKKKNKKLNPRGNSVQLSKKMLEKEKRMDFFKGL